MKSTVNTKHSIFIVEDERKMRDILAINLSKRYDVVFFSDAETAESEFEKNRPELIVTDVRLPGMDGIEFMDRIKRRSPRIPFIVFTGYGSIDHAVDTIKRGAFDYITKPVKIDDLVRSIDRALSYLEVSESSFKLDVRYRVRGEDSELEFITRDPTTIQMLNLAQKAARFNAPILITGETGTGKELVAQYIHTLSNRKGPFVQLNCASIPKDIIEGELFGYRKGAFTGAVQDYTGKIAFSNSGTLFLDEVSELPPEAQAKLLRVLEIPEYYPIGSNVKRVIDLHLIAATNRNIRRMVDKGLFRNDLYYRIAVIPVTIPVLRERRCDILPLVNYFLESRNRDCVLSREAKLQLLQYGWPGNVRELKNVMERSVLLSDDENVLERIVFNMDGLHGRDGGTAGGAEEPGIREVPETWDGFKKFKSNVLKSRKAELEKAFIERLLVKYGGNVSMTARKAGMDRRQLQVLIKKLGIDAGLFRADGG